MCREVLYSGHLAKEAVEVSGRALRHIRPAPRQRHEHRAHQEICVRLPPAPLILRAACVAAPPSISTLCCVTPGYNAIKSLVSRQVMLTMLVLQCRRECTRYTV